MAGRRCALGGRVHRISRNITEILLEAGVVTPEQVERGVLRQRETGLRIGETLVEMAAITEEDVGWALSRQLGLTFVDIDPDALDRDFVRSFRESLLRRSDAVPLLRADDSVSMAVADPTDDEMLARLEDEAGTTLQLVIGTPSAIRRALDGVFGPRIAHTVGEAASPPGTGALYDVVWERSGATFLAFHVASALKRGAGEVHFLPGAGQLHVHYREAGRLVPVASEPARVHESLLARIEALGGPVPGDGVHVRGLVRCPLPQGDVPLELSLLRGSQGVVVTATLRPPRDVAPTLEQLGVRATDAAELRDAIAGGAGLVVVAGPRRAGGSSALAAMVDALAAAPRRLLAFEPDAATPLPGATRVHLAPTDARAAWQDIAVAQNADVVLLDDVLTGAAIDDALSPAGARRLLLVRTDWCDTATLLDQLCARPRGRSTLARRLLAIVQVRWVAGGDAAGLAETLLVGDALREAIRAGEDGRRLLRRAAAAGFRTLEEQAAERVAAGTLDPGEARRALT